ncbi:EAL domain-containing protein [Herminiimonas sp. CN]|uniref:EAL domain-containing protein n=1 Tax=Herminiimonas sp. CN TaxID=1349818 RepID=UPI001EE67219|nr:EAL domain-containing protein [Herminiimonas sp. CN]
MSPAGIALLYAGIAALWIVASGRLLTFTVADPVLQGRIELAKGLAFVLVTSGLLYLLLKLRRAPAPASLLRNSPWLPAANRLLPLFIALLLVVPLLGLAVVKLYGPQLERKAYGNLASLALLQSEQIENWLAERHDDGAALAGNAAFAAQIGRLVRQNAPAALFKPVLAQVENLRAAYGYDSILLLDSGGTLLAALGDRSTLSPELQALLRQPLASRQVQRSNLYLDQAGRMQLDWVVPIAEPGSQAGPVVAAVVLRVAPERFLFPLIRRWTENSASGETMLVRRDGDAATYLNTLRHAWSATPILQRPLTESELPAAVFVGQAGPGTMQGRDYRGTAVLAAHRPVAGTDWHLVAKIDRAEVLEPLYTLVFWISLIALAAVIAVSTAIVLLWRQQRHLHGLALLAHQAKADRLLRQFFDLPFIGIAMISPSAKNVVQFNDHLCTILGYSREELAARNWMQLTHPDDLAAETCQIERIESGESEGYALDKRFICKDGAVRFATVDVKCVRQSDGAVDFFVATVADITERRAGEAKIQRLTQFYAALSQCNQAIVRCTSEAELFAQICCDAVQLGGMKMAWIGLLDPVSRRIQPVASYGDGTAYLDGLEISADDNQAAGCGPTGAAIRGNQPYWCQDFQSDPRTASWHARSERFGWRASAALPLCRNGVVIGVFSLYADETHVFDEAVRSLLVEMAIDISYALDNFARETARQQAEQALRDSEERYRAVTQSANDAIITSDKAGNIVSWNQGAAAIFGYVQAEVLGQPLTLLMPERYRQRHQAGMRRIQSGGAPEIVGRMVELTGVRKDGSEFPLELLLAKCEVASGWFMTGTIRDISQRKQNEAKLGLAAQVFEQSGEGIMITDAHHRIVRINHAFTAITGYSEAEALDQNPRMLSSGRQDQDFYRGMWAVIKAQGHWQGEVWNRRKDGSVYPEWLSISKVLDSQGNLTNYIGIFSDISQYKAAQEQIQRLAHFDALTGLPNRVLLNDRTSQALSMAHRSHAPLALMFIDLDRFKNVNDSLGHRIGDALLVALAQRLCAAVREQDTVSRLGGDEFILVLPDTDADGAAHIAKILLETAVQPYQIEQHELTITSSIGIAMYPGDGEDFESLSKCADIAMYRAKQDGRNNFCFFTSEMQARSVRTLQLENALRRALERDQLALHYQPQVSLQDGSIIGAEALLRWQHPELGWILPAEFIPIAEDSGQILQLGEWVLRTAARQCRAWIESMPGPLMMAVNLSAVQFRHPHLPELVMQILEQEGLPPSCLELELTESAAMDNPLAAVVVMDRLHACGIRMSIDDFGTGYSSLSYLKRFQVYKLKIDQSFVRDISADPEDEAIVGAIISMARSLGLRTIAEGVETERQLAFLREKGCDEAQGYYFGKPMPAERFEAALRQRQDISA